MVWTTRRTSGRYQAGYRDPDGKRRSADTFTQMSAALRAANAAAGRSAS